jgi:group I intron endonuclease
MGRIYIAKNVINGKGYIGQTIRAIKTRLKEHRTGKSKGCRAFHGAIKKYGWENFKIDWYECPDDELNKHEKWMVNLMGTLSPRGYNLREGGGSGGKWSEESKQRMIKSHLGKPKSVETKQKMSDGRRGEKNHNFGKPKSEETREKQSEAKLGEKNSTSTRVYQYDLDGTFIGSFASTREAGRHLNNDGTNIGACARYKRKTAHKFKWSYELTIFL